MTFSVKSRCSPPTKLGRSDCCSIRVPSLPSVSICVKSHLTQQDGEDGFLGVEAVFGLVEDDAVGAVHDAGAHLFAAVGGEAVEEQIVGLGGGDEFFVHL